MYFKALHRKICIALLCSLSQIRSHTYRSKLQVFLPWYLFHSLNSQILKCEWIWQNLASTHRATFGDKVILSNNYIIASWWIMLKKWNLQQVLVYWLAIIVWVNIYRSIKWSTKKIESQGSNLGSYWTFLVFTAFQTEDERHWPASEHQYKRAMTSQAPKHHSRLTD